MENFIIRWADKPGMNYHNAEKLYISILMLSTWPPVGKLPSILLAENNKKT